MKKFKFKYENILKMRLNEEIRIKTLISELSNSLKKLELEREDLFLKQQEYNKNIESLLSGGCKARELLLIETSKKFYENSFEVINRKIDNASIELENARTEYLEALKEKKIMEKLKEKLSKNYLNLINKSEEKTIEEIVNYKNFK